MYTQIRFWILIIVMILICIIRIKRVRNVKKFKTLLIIITVILYLAVTIYPIENLFFGFNTLEESFKYTYGDNEIIKTIYVGGNAIVMFKSNDSVNISTFYKHKKGWSIHSTSNWKKMIKIGYFTSVSKRAVDGNTKLVIVYQHIDPRNNPYVIEFKDSLGSEFNLLYKFENSGMENYYYTLVEWPVRGYDLSFDNGQSIHMD